MADNNNINNEMPDDVFDKTTTDRIKEVDLQKTMESDYIDYAMSVIGVEFYSKVRKTRQSVALEPMNPYERRIIHSALQNDRYVTTHSEGDEPFRRVVVTLKK